MLTNNSSYTNESSRLEHWERKHISYANQDWIKIPSIYAAKHIVGRLLPNRNILDLGAGQGQDSIFFASLGHSVTALDFSPYAINKLDEIKVERGIPNITTVTHDLSKALPFADNLFNVVYSHLGVHFFNDEFTRKIFIEIARVMTPGGLLCVLANSTDDPEYGEGVKIEENYFELKKGDFKRYLTREYMFELIKENFIPYCLDDRGVCTHKDSTDSFINLMASKK